MREKLKEASETVADELGSGWSESIYHRSLERELSERGIPFTSEGTIPVMYRGAPVGRRRPDLFVSTDNGLIILELKAGSNSGNAQLKQYLELTKASEDIGEIVGGALIQFNAELEYQYIDCDESER